MDSRVSYYGEWNPSPEEAVIKTECGPVQHPHICFTQRMAVPNTIYVNFRWGYTPLADDFKAFVARVNSIEGVVAFVDDSMYQIILAKGGLYTWDEILPLVQTYFYQERTEYGIRLGAISK